MLRRRTRTTAYVSLLAGLVLASPVISPASAASPGGAEAVEPTPTPTPAPKGSKTKPPKEGSAPAPAAEPAPKGAAPTTGGAVGTPAPRITSVRCRARCSGAAALPGATLDLRGRRIGTVDAVTFLGAPGEADDLTVVPNLVTRKRILVAMPDLAATGPVAVASADGAESPPSRQPLTVGVVGAAEAPAGLDVTVRAPKVFIDGTRKAGVAFVLRGSESQPVDVVLTRESDGATVARWSPGVVSPGVPQSVTWDGTAGGRVQPPGRYAFRVSVSPGTGSGGGATASQASAPPAESFELIDHQFPIRGAHRYGGGFGDGRGHQGADVFAACGTPLVAARGGRVKFKQFHSRAGHYLVIDGEQTDMDYAYMHLRSAALVGEGDRVRTGQPIGFVGDTGRATGCHLHFELWSAPGWYDGGRPFDPLPLLRAWDAGS